METNSEIWVHDMFTVASRLRETASDLNYLSKAFSRTGNSKVADELYNHVLELHALADETQKLTSARVNDDLRQAQQGAANMLMAALNAGGMSQKENSEENHA